MSPNRKKALVMFFEFISVPTLMLSQLIVMILYRAKFLDDKELKYSFKPTVKRRGRILYIFLISVLIAPFTPQDFWKFLVAASVFIFYLNWSGTLIRSYET